MGWYLGYGTNYDAMHGDQQAVVDYCISSGLRKFYYPEPLDGRDHQWTFLRPWRNKTLAEDASSMVLDDDTAGVEGNFFFAPDADHITDDGVEQVSMHTIRQLRQGNQG